MKFKPRVAVHRDGKLSYWTAGSIALRMCLSGVAKRRGQGMVELPAVGSVSDKQMTVLDAFQDMKPTRHCYGSHTTPKQADRKTFAACHYRAVTGQVGAVTTSWRTQPHEAEPQVLSAI